MSFASFIFHAPQAAKKKPFQKLSFWKESFWKGQF